MLHLLQQTLTPHVSLRQNVENWYDISLFLRENPRKRTPQMVALAGSLS